jgi:hypothetical protein
MRAARRRVSDSGHFTRPEQAAPGALTGSVKKAATLGARLGGGRGDHDESRHRLPARPGRRVGAHFEAWLQARSSQINHPRHDRVLADDHMTRLGLAIIDVDLIALGGMGDRLDVPVGHHQPGLVHCKIHVGPFIHHMDLFRGPRAGLGAVLVGRTKIDALLDIILRCRLAYQHPRLWRDGDVDIALRRRQNDVGRGDRLYSASNANALRCLLRARGCSSEDDQREGDKGKAHGISPARTSLASSRRHFEFEVSNAG